MECLVCTTKYERLYKCISCTYEVCISCALHIARNAGVFSLAPCPQCRRPFQIMDGETVINVSYAKIKMHRFAALSEPINLYDNLVSTGVKMTFGEFYERFKEGFKVTSTSNAYIVCAINQNFNLVRSTLTGDIQMFEFETFSYKDSMYTGEVDDLGCIVKRTCSKTTKAVVFSIPDVEFIISNHHSDPDHTRYYCLICADGHKPPSKPHDENVDEGYPLFSSVPHHLKSATHKENLRKLSSVHS